MKRRTVLLLTHSGDFYVPDIVDAAIERLGHDAIRVDTDGFPAHGALTVSSDDSGVRALLDIGTLELDLSRVAAIWCRRIWTSQASVDVDPHFANAAAAQARDAFAGVLALLEDGGVRFVNALGPQARAEHKVVQLQAARAVGLMLPPSLVTNDPIAVRAFAEEHTRIVAKMLVPLSQTMDGSGAFVYTSAVDEADLAALVASPASLQAAPMIFQQRIDKVLEVRAVVVGKRVFAASTSAGALDWRLGTGGAWRIHPLPRSLERACVRLVAQLGLVMGALDFLVDADGTHWFLEINPAGEWGWLEKDLGLPIAGAIAQALVGHRARP